MPKLVIEISVSEEVRRDLDLRARVGYEYKDFSDYMLKTVYNKMVYFYDELPIHSNTCPNCGYFEIGDLWWDCPKCDFDMFDASEDCQVRKMLDLKVRILK